MTIYIERVSGMITIDEWLTYISTDSELTLSENGTAINPITRVPMRFRIPGRVLWKNCEINYKQGKIGCEGISEGLIEKLSEIAAALSADVFDCGEKI